MVEAQVLNKILKTRSIDILLENDITPDHFYDYADEYEYIMNHYNTYGNVPDIETFKDKFEEFTVVDVEESDRYLVDTLNEEYQYREMVPIIQKAGKLVVDDAVAATEYLKTALRELGIFGSTVGIDIISQADKRYEKYKEKLNSTTPWMYPTGFQELDDIIGGLMPEEEFVIIVARTNQGKSWVLAKMLEHNCIIGKNVGYISPEMSDDQIGYRFDSLYGHLSNFDLLTGHEVPGYEEHIKKLMSPDSKFGKFIVAQPHEFGRKITVSKLRTFCLNNKLDILGIDGITYLTDERYRKGDNKTTSLTNISEDLMSLSCELKIPIIAVVQANRNGIGEGNYVPALEDIRDSDGIAHNASKVFSVRQYNNKLVIAVTKARGCPVGAKLAYDWIINTSHFTYNPNTDDEDKQSDEVESRFRKRDDVENKQPLTARRSSGNNPF